MPKNIYSPKTEEVSQLEQTLTEAEINRRITDSYNFELDSYNNIDSPKTMVQCIGLRLAMNE